MPKHLFLSPHYDDAALSCGGAIAQLSRQGETPVVVTIFGGKPDTSRLSPFARAIHARPQAGDDLIDQRRTEEREALSFLDAPSIVLDYLDCIYRQDSTGERWLYDTEEAIFGPVDPTDDVLVDALAGVLHAMAQRQGAERLVAPLAIGNHVDHQVVFRAARRLHAMGLAVAFYEDYPYVVRDPHGLSRATAQGQAGDGWAAELVILRERDLRQKIAAVCAYRSQLGVLFGSDGQGSAADVGPALTMYAAEVARTASGAQLAERLWRLRAQFGTSSQLS